MADGRVESPETTEPGRIEWLRTNMEKRHSFQGFDRLKCVFIHIPKTGGVSIASLLFGHQVGHWKASELRGHFPDDYYWFTFVRDPFDRLFSAWKYRRGIGWAKKRPFEEFVMESLEDSLNEIHYRPQVSWLDDFSGDVWSFAHMKGHVGLIADKLGIALPHPLRHLNKSPKEDPGWTKEMVEKVYRIYADDFKLVSKWII